ncbi:DUF3786 domain-containing protein [Clostridium sp. CX1]|uniref:DUF3786 domain-containing protein n=1 Tax=Clostridium sp. CX1 TaxID=2978346 RepID=UPI0021BFBB3B|nr:DUF3786 domain-containing protein [Clostridium sp. CX1]MCT8976349.1 DUF3786 domain-containing protein [Clostridium sp. CX1]
MDRVAIEEKRKDKIPYDYHSSIFKDFDPELMSKNTGCHYDKEKGEFVVRLMGEDIIVKYPSGRVLKADGSEINKYPPKTLVLRYLMNAKGVAPLNRDITYRDVDGGNMYFRNFNGRCLLRLAKTFGNSIDKFKNVFEKLQAEKVNMGDAAYKFEFLNNIYVTFALWEGDEEFPPASQILFDGNAPFYFTAEDLAVVGDVSIGTITTLAYSK